MSWLTDYVRPRIPGFSAKKKEVPDDLWTSCPSCQQMIYAPLLSETHRCCPHCEHHMRMPMLERFALLFDDGQFERIDIPSVAADPLKFKDLKRYGDRLKDAQTKTGEKDSLGAAHGLMGGREVVVAIMNFAFMGGSMGMAMGETFVKAAEKAIEAKAPFIIFTASGGARMQEGILSLMQMPRTTVALQMVKEAGLPYLVVLTDPTTGGVSASFAMLGDLTLAEPGAQIGFAGKRVIKQTTGEDLPDGFQTAEFLQERGIIDVVVARKDMKDKLVQLLSLLLGDALLELPSPEEVPGERLPDVAAEEGSQDATSDDAATEAKDA